MRYYFFCSAGDRTTSKLIVSTKEEDQEAQKATKEAKEESQAVHVGGQPAGRGT